MTELYDQDDARSRVQTAIQPGPLPSGSVWPATGGNIPDRRSVYRREADRRIIAEQAETIRLLEGRLAMREEAIRRQNIVLATLRSYARRLETGS
jgi:hypothetical protein